MNVGDLLGLDEGGELLDRARERWSAWVVMDGRLAVVDDFDDLRAWLAAADREAADDVLLGLAMLAAPDGGDELAAAGALAKCLLPGACRLAGWVATQRRSLLPGGVELATELVASQLWIEVRSFPWRRGQKVAANILMNTRAGVLRECGDAGQVARADRTWSRTDLVEAFVIGNPGTEVHAGLLADPAAGLGERESPLEELLGVLGWACDRDVISTEDRYLLLCLVEEAARVTVVRRREHAPRAHAAPRDSGCGGLMADDIAARVAPRIGASEATVRRRASRSMRALAAAIPTRSSDEC